MRSNLFLRTLFAALFLAASAVAASAQTTQVNGTVKLKQADGTEVPVVDAQVDIYRTDIKGEWHVKTDKKGHYIYAGLPFVGTYALVVSAPGARPNWATKQRFTTSQQRDFLLQPGDGSRPTLEQVKTFDAGGRGGGTARAGGGDAAPAESKEDKAKREELDRKVKEVESKNAEISKGNEVVARTFKAGNDALFAKPPRLEEAIAQYREGLAARPDEVALLTNLAEALRQRGDDTFNASVHSTDNDAKLKGLETAKKDWSEAGDLSRKAVDLVKAASPTGENVNQAAYEQNKKAALSVRAIALRRVATKVDQTQAQAAWDAYQEFIGMEADPVKKSKLKGEALQTVFDAGSVDLAVTQARAVLAEDPENVDANRILGLALFATGDKTKYQEAANYLQHYVDKAPDTDPLKQSAKESLEYLKTAENVKPEKTPARPARRRP
jgi:tetratricopeptide (TPR) repeat protein